MRSFGGTTPSRPVSGRDSLGTGVDVEVRSFGDTTPSRPVSGRDSLGTGYDVEVEGSDSEVE